MNKRNMIFFILIFITSAHVWAVDDLNIVLTNPKKDWVSFFKQLKEMFNITIFVETGTYEGDTTAQAARVFDEVHSIELSKQLYETCKKRFENAKNIFLYNGDSSKVFPHLLPNLKHGRVLFWLDGHWSTGITARGDQDTPIMQELESIRKNNLQNSVILIDDIREFQSNVNSKYMYGNRAYPDVKEMSDFIKTINKDYSFAMVGDIFMAYEKKRHVTISLYGQACAISRLYNGYNYSIDEVLAAEKIIAHASEKEKDLIAEIMQYQNPHYYLWHGLILQNEGKHAQACEYFNKILRNQGWNYDHWRIYLYLAESLYKNNQRADAKNVIEKVIEMDPKHGDIQLLLKKINSIS